jgi:hypothetical protein
VKSNCRRRGRPTIMSPLWQHTPSAVLTAGAADTRPAHGHRTARRHPSNFFFHTNHTRTKPIHSWIGAHSHNDRKQKMSSTKMSATTEADVEAHVAAVEQLQRDAFALQAALERSRHVIVSTLMRSRLYDIMEGRVLIPRGSLASEMEDPRLKFPASLTSSGRLLLGDLGTVGSLLEGDGTEDIDRYLQQHPVRAVLVCMGADAARAVSKQFKKRGLDYLGLEGCVDEEGYPLLERHLEASNAFIREKLLAAAPDGCVLVHCHEGKNRSCALCVAFLMVQHRMRLTEAIQHVWSKRPMVLSNESFLQQLIDLAAREGLLS